MNPGGFGGGGYGAPPGGGGSPQGGHGGPTQPGGYVPATQIGYGPPPGAWAPVPAGLPPGYTPPETAPALQGGIPWEQKGGSLVGQWWETMKACNDHTRPFFACAAQNEKGDAITFAMVSGAVSGAFVGLFYVLLSVMISAGLMIGMPALGGHKSTGGMLGTSAFAAGFTLGIGLFYAVIITAMSAIGAAMRAFVWAGLHHVLLLMLGGIGERKTFMHTVRVAAYAEGAAMPWIWIPVAGPFIAMFHGIKNVVVGYDETHRCGTGRATLVLLAPLLCCCGCNLLMLALGLLPAIL
jgi:hypothetical protein